jgi:hypothetical protein
VAYGHPLTFFKKEGVLSMFRMVNECGNAIYEVETEHQKNELIRRGFHEEKINNKPQKKRGNAKNEDEN